MATVTEELGEYGETKYCTTCEHAIWPRLDALRSSVCPKCGEPLAFGVGRYRFRVTKRFLRRATIEAVEFLVKNNEAKTPPSVRPKP